MDLNGKKTERMLMRVSEDMAREIRALSELECRPIQDQCRLLIMIGLQHCKANAGNGTTMRMRRAVSTGVTPSTFAEEQAKELPSTGGKSRQFFLPGTAGPIPTKKRRTA